MRNSNNNTNKPFIHLFETGGEYYLFDVNADKILHITAGVYRYLKNSSTNSTGEDEYAYNYIQRLKENGLLKSTHVEITEHPETKYLKYLLESNMTSLILQVTQNCNLRCDYCVYSGSYYNRTHTNKRMSFELAKRSINFLAEHSRDTEDIHIGFYGGEPLLEYELIKECIEYSHTRLEGKHIHFNITTNGTLVTKEMISFFEKNGVVLMFSLDGPQKIHDLSRKEADNKGSFAIIYSNLQMINKDFSNYFKEKVMFNTVLNPERSYSCISDYVSSEDLIKDSVFLTSTINLSNTKIKRKPKEEFLEEIRYEYFMLLLSKIGEFNQKRMSPLSRTEGVALDNMRDQKAVSGYGELPRKHHHGGPCIPGNYRLFVNVDGDFYPCERVSETCEYQKIGNIEEGFDLDNAERILNVERMTEESCHTCWAYNYCSICIADINTSYDNPADSISEKCSDIRRSTEERFKDYCVLKKYGYQY